MLTNKSNNFKKKFLKILKEQSASTTQTTSHTFVKAEIDKLKDFFNDSNFPALNLIFDKGNNNNDDKSELKKILMDNYEKVFNILTDSFFRSNVRINSNSTVNTKNLQKLGLDNYYSENDTEKYIESSDHVKVEISLGEVLKNCKKNFNELFNLLNNKIGNDYFFSDIISIFNEPANLADEELKAWCNKFEPPQELLAAAIKSGIYKAGKTYLQGIPGDPFGDNESLIGNIVITAYQKAHDYLVITDDNFDDSKDLKSLKIKFNQLDQSSPESQSEFVAGGDTDPYYYTLKDYPLKSGLQNGLSVMYFQNYYKDAPEDNSDYNNMALEDTLTFNDNPSDKNEDESINVNKHTEFLSINNEYIQSISKSFILPASIDDSLSDSNFDIYKYYLTLSGEKKEASAASNSFGAHIFFIPIRSEDTDIFVESDFYKALSNRDEGDLIFGLIYLNSWNDRLIPGVYDKSKGMVYSNESEVYKNKIDVNGNSSDEEKQEQNENIQEGFSYRNIYDDFEYSLICYSGEKKLKLENIGYLDGVSSGIRRLGFRFPVGIDNVVIEVCIGDDSKILINESGKFKNNELFTYKLFKYLNNNIKNSKKLLESSFYRKNKSLNDKKYYMLKLSKKQGF